MVDSICKEQLQNATSNGVKLYKLN